MATRYTKPILSGYNTNAPPDDGTQTPSNEITWAKHKTKLGDPLKTYIDAINTDVAAVLNDDNTTLVDQWPISLSDAAYDSATSITATLHTDKFGNTRPVAGDRIVATGSSTGTIFGTVDSVSGSGPATITITWDSGSLSNEALTVWVGIVSATNTSFPPSLGGGGGGMTLISKQRLTEDQSGNAVFAMSQDITFSDIDAGDLFFIYAVVDASVSTPPAFLSQISMTASGSLASVPDGFPADVRIYPASSSIEPIHHMAVFPFEATSASAPITLTVSWSTISYSGSTRPSTRTTGDTQLGVMGVQYRP